MQPRQWRARLLRGGELRRLHPAHVENDGWHARQRELREIFEYHLRRNLDYVSLPERLAQRGGNALGQLGIVVGRIRGRLDFHQRLTRRSPSQGLALRYALNRCQQVLSHLRLVRANRELKLDLVRNDVVLGPAVEGTDRDDGWIPWIDFPRHDGLQRQYSARGDYDGINRVLRLCSMATAPEDGDVHRIGRSHRVARCVADLTCGQRGIIVDCQAKLGFGKQVNRPSLSMAAAPAPISSAGWPISISVPCQRCRFSAISVAVPSHEAMWMS